MFYTIQNPENVPEPKIVALNYTLADELGLSIDELKSGKGVSILSGNTIIEGTTPIAQAYGGSQFGYFSVLGDGRAVLLGEVIDKNGQRIDIALKGSGKTPYSRGGDGKAALGPMLREFIISEAMHGFRIPTTRSLAVLETGEIIVRDKLLPGAIVVRTASSHIRVGTFQYAARYGSYDDLKSLADYAIKRHYRECMNKDEKYLSFFKSVMKSQAYLISRWQLIGFIHGVMNTDNVAISGETIDYGPCAFMDMYDPKTVFSSIDTGGRYAYGNQPNIGMWNLARFAESLIPLFSSDKEEGIAIAQKAISEYPIIFKEYWNSGMRAKLGLFDEEQGDETIIESLLSLMKTYEADYTNTFRALTLNKPEDILMHDKEDFKIWYQSWEERLKRQNRSKEDVYELMKNSNPAVIPRNHIVEEVLNSAVKNDDYGPMDKLLSVLKNPYEYSEAQKEYAHVPEKKRDVPYRTFCGT